jgi:arylsulfatase A-like enzyme
VGGEGVTFTNSYVNFPLCCPSRATFLTGQYMHNSGVQGNNPPYGGYGALDHSNTLPVWLKDAGYKTVHIGKYLNGYGSARPTERPPGWTEWYGLIDPYTYMSYGYRMNRNGVVTQYGSAPQDYQADVLADTAVEVITRRVRNPAPLFLTVAPLTPHSEVDLATGTWSPIRPAPRHKGVYDTLPLPTPPNFNEADVSDKAPANQALPLLTPDRISGVAVAYRRQAEALLAIDEMVERIYEAVEASGELDDTVIVFVSDNGYFHGEHRIPSGKGRAFEESVEVPLLVRGPGFAPGETAAERVTNADLAPTFVALGEASPRRVMDGRSLLDPDPGRPLLFEATHDVPNPFTAVRSGRWMWVEYAAGGRELYDMVEDPYQLVSRHNDPSLAAKKAELTSLLARLRTCAGDTCRAP